jgi:hypothetical protein
MLLSKTRFKEIEILVTSIYRVQTYSVDVWTTQEEIGLLVEMRLTDRVMEQL